MDIPKSISGRWEHGWVAPYKLVEPILATSTPEEQAKSRTFFVANKRIAESLLDNDYQAIPIGLPIAYTKNLNYDRKTGSLLIMPQHSLHDSPFQRPFEEYVDEINSIRHYFSDAIVCLHSSCILHRLWIDEFEKAGYPVIEGANPNNLNSLQRMRDIFSQFEYVTTNGYSSLIAYASAFGAKLFIYGTYCEIRPSELMGHRYYQENPSHAYLACEYNSERILRMYYPHFFCNPLDSSQHIYWGQQEIGADQIISPKQMRQYFGPNWGIRYNLKSFIKKNLCSNP